MDDHKIVEAVRFLLEARQADLFRREAKISNLLSRQGAEIREELSSLEDLVESARRGYEE